MAQAQTLREEPARFFSTLTSLNEFDKKEVRNIIRVVLNPTQRETCFIALLSRRRQCRIHPGVQPCQANSGHSVGLAFPASRAPAVGTEIGRNQWAAQESQDSVHQ
jgi:hypothetical protein